MLVVGVLSGTSVDGIDVAVCRISEERIPCSMDNASEEFSFRYKNELVAFETIPFPREDRDLILSIIEGKEVHIREICRLNFRIGELFGKAIIETLRRHNINAMEVDLVGSHGQTIWHDVTNDGGSTLQLGEGDVIASVVKTDVVSDFRTADVAHGGQGAPLTSIQDFLMSKTNSEIRWKAIQNIGGMGNVSFVNSKSIYGFDTGPGNILSDLAVHILSGGEKTYDEDGEMASKGKTNETVLRKIMSLPYFTKTPPKTTGRELFSRSFVEEVIKDSRTLEMSDNDIMSTILEITVESIYVGYKSFGPPDLLKSDEEIRDDVNDRHENQQNEEKPCVVLEEIVVNGGGARNKELMRRMKKRFQPHNVKVVKNETEMDSKEAKLFALLAYLNVKNRVSNIPSVTGASRKLILGKLSKYGKIV